MMVLFVFLMSFFAVPPVLPQSNLPEQSSTSNCENNGQVGKNLIYTRSIKSYPSIDNDKNLYDDVISNLKKISSKIITEKQFNELSGSVKNMFEDGICYGGAISFLLSSAERPDATITLPFTTEEKARALHFQALVKVQVLFKKEYEKAFFYSDKAMRWCDFCMALEKQKKKQLNAVGLHSLATVKIQKDPKNSDLAVALIDNIARFIEEKNATNVLICFDTIVNEKPVGHAVLVQLDRKRIYDGGFGIYEYNSLTDLLQDFIKYPSSTYFNLEAFGALPN